MTLMSARKQAPLPLLKGSLLYSHVTVERILKVTLPTHPAFRLVLPPHLSPGCSQPWHRGTTTLMPLSVQTIAGKDHAELSTTKQQYLKESLSYLLNHAKKVSAPSPQPTEMFVFRIGSAENIKA
jgi:uncharacterized UBP type Zn finger protein